MGRGTKRKERLANRQTDMWVGRKVERRTAEQTCRQTDGRKERERFLMCLHNDLSVRCKVLANNTVHLHKTGTRIHVAKLHFDVCLETSTMVSCGQHGLCDIFMSPLRPVVCKVLLNFKFSFYFGQSQIPWKINSGYF